MKTLLHWFNAVWMPLLVVFLLIFIPLYPKFPLVDVKYTWVYVRVEDFIVLFTVLLWTIEVIRHKETLRTPATIPILIFWIIGTIATIHGVLLFFPSMADVFPSVAFLSLLRRIEYMSLFFVAYSSIKDKKTLLWMTLAVIGTLVGVIAYGFGQKYFGFYAYLTMNEQYAKGIPIQLSSLSRVSSTFAGHYDLAAYLVLILPIVVSLAFAVRKLYFKAVLLGIAALGVVLLFMTVSRISFFALFVALAAVLFFQKRKLVLLSVPVMTLIVLLVVSFSPSLINRFGSTIKEIDVMVDAQTGDPIGHPKEVPSAYFADKVIKQQFNTSIANIDTSASPSSLLIIPYTNLSQHVLLLVESNISTGENLPQGTGYINLSLSPVERRVGTFYFEKKQQSAGPASVYIISGRYLLKKVLAYDLSFTTRFQGEWPRAFDAFKKNILFGSGYGSVGLAVDNSYLRMLAEVGLVGLCSFLAIFIVIGIYTRRVFSDIDSKLGRSFIIGYIAGLVGIAINAAFIDVFEASKVAFVLWLLSGVVLGTVHLYQKKSIEYVNEFKKVVTSPIAIAVYLLLITVILYSPMVKNYFVGDDFTWFRWAADCNNGQAGSQLCHIRPSTLIEYFTKADGFFYRPGTKIYFLFMYTFFWLNQTVYHFVSLFLQFIVSVLVFFLAKKILKNAALGFLIATVFLLMSGYSEAVFWISATGFLFTACFSLLSLMSFMGWYEQKQLKYFFLTVSFFALSMLFHELGIVTPLLFILYAGTVAKDTFNIGHLLKNRHYQLLHVPLFLYLILRFMAHSHWLSGDYNYNILKLPLNVTGNAIGYFLLTLAGPISSPLYELERTVLKAHVGIAAVAMLIGLGLLYLMYRTYKKHVAKDDQKLFQFGIGFFFIGLLPFLGLGNMSSRYGYFASIGIAFVSVLVLKKVYMYLLSNGRDIAMGVVITVFGVFGLLQIIQLQQIHSDWYESGEIARKFFVTINSIYDDYWATSPMEFHFVNVPIRKGQAWVFPVGLGDALWLIFRNPNVKVFSWPTTEAAFNAVQYNSKTQKVLEFDSYGDIHEKIKPLTTQ